MSGQNFIGSKISLISNSDIRYVGTLHSLNAEESTVALEQVRSFGTEGRRSRPDEEIPQSDNVFEFVVFRGSDIKDLQVFEAPAKPAPAPPPANMPNDPAIMQSSMMKGYGGGAGMNPYMMPPSYPPMQQQYWGSPMYPMPSPMGTAPPPPHVAMQQQQQQQQPPASASAPGQTAPSPARSAMAHSGAGSTTGAMNDSVSKPVAPMAPASRAPTTVSREAAAVDDVKRTNAAVDNLASNLEDLKVESKQKDDDQRQQPQQQNRNRRNFANNAPGPRRGRHEHANKASIDIPKSDFDFESSNAKFNKGEIVKEVSRKDGDEQQPQQVQQQPQPQVEEEEEQQQEDDEVVIPPAMDEAFYDKQKSFFDNISCESKERSEQNGSIDRRAKFQEERKLNLETFGEVSVDHPRYRNYRGRGGYRGRGRGNSRGYRGNRGGAKSMA